MENLPWNTSKATEELVRGRDFAYQLRNIFQKSINGGHDDEDDGEAEDLVGKVLSSFSSTLLLLNKNNFCKHQDQSNDIVSQQPHALPAKSEESQESCKSSAVKDRRGCYKRRRTSHTWEKDSEAPADDGHAWRKYGQKMILNAKYPRNYFRCTHKFDQNCQATKQVQKIQEEPPLYRTTYYGYHTCRNLVNPEIILDTDHSPSPSSLLISFDNTVPAQNKNHPFYSIKMECKQEIFPSSSSSDYLLSPQLTLEPDHMDVISDVFYDPVEFDSVLSPFGF